MRVMHEASNTRINSLSYIISSRAHHPAWILSFGAKTFPGFLRRPCHAVHVSESTHRK